MKLLSLLFIAALVCALPPTQAGAATDTATQAPTGDQHRSYVFALTGDTLPYRLYVPRSYRPDKEYPMVVVLHGGGSSENRPMDKTGLEEEAEKRGYIVLSPVGYNRFGGYGNIYPVVVTPKTASVSGDFAATAKREGPAKVNSGAPPPAAPPTSAETQAPAAEDEYVEQPAGFLTDAHIGEFSEKETLAAIDDVQQHYRIDKRRLFLMGNSAGGVGTLYLAAKYPQMWAAIAPQGGVIAAWSYPYWRLRDAHLATLFVHGAMDEHCNPKWSQVMAERARADGADATLLVVPGGTHGGAWTMVLPQIFDFFAAHPQRSHP